MALGCHRAEQTGRQNRKFRQSLNHTIHCNDELRLIYVITFSYNTYQYHVSHDNTSLSYNNPWSKRESNKRLMKEDTISRK